MDAKQMGEFIYIRLRQIDKQQKELAAAIDVPVSTVNSWLRLGRDIPARYVGPIAAFLQVSVNGLLGLAEGDEAAKCQWTPGVIIKPDGTHMLDACQYVLAARYWFCKTVLQTVTVPIARRQPMKKKYCAALVVGAAISAWYIHRNRKYPVRSELRFANKLAVPGCVLNGDTARLANRALAWTSCKLPVPPHGIERRCAQIPSENGTMIRLTIYRPENLDRAAPCLVYFHGGGFCLGDAGYIHRYAAQYAQGARCVVVFVHYRTSDIAPFPAPFQDCYAALCWVWENAPNLRVDRACLAVGGDSAGGALAAACALRARDESGPRLCFQLLVYPVTDCRMGTISMKEYIDSPLWNAELNRKMWGLYLRDGNAGTPEYAAPMLAHDFSGLPPGYVEVEEFDCLHDEGVAYAQALGAAGVDVQLEDTKGTFHGFDFFSNKEISRAMVQKRVWALRQIFWH